MLKGKHTRRGHNTTRNPSLFQAPAPAYPSPVHIGQLARTHNWPSATPARYSDALMSCRRFFFDFEGERRGQCRDMKTKSSRMQALWENMVILNIP